MRRLLRRVMRAIRPDPIPACDEPTLHALKHLLREDSNAVDVGCNRGSILREIVRLAPTGQHFALEPIPSLFHQLRKTFPGVMIWNVVASDVKGTVPFNYFRDFDGFSGMVRRDIGPDRGTACELHVQSERLDELLPPDVRVDLMKIDVEGAELNVLRGAREIIQRDHPAIIFECGKGGLDLYGFRPDDVFDFFTRFGMTIQKLSTWQQQGKAMSHQEFADEFEAQGEYMFVATTGQTITSTVDRADEPVHTSVNQSNTPAEADR
ncbi:MAG: FkbM family methyltransferase [Phycisphaerae bacterium]|nr:FkbM family methyltransferase [Phycisphaerae bacterium]